jgi:hypothetical protein
MKSKSPLSETEKLPAPVLPEKRKKRIDPDEVELDLEKQNQVLKKMISRLKKKE